MALHQSLSKAGETLICLTLNEIGSYLSFAPHRHNAACL